MSEQEKQDIEKLFQILQRGNNPNVLLPVQLDSRSGMGLYIVGKAYFQNMGSIYREIKGSCCYAHFCLNDFAVVPGYGVTLSWTAKEREIAGQCNAPTLDEALKWFQTDVRSSKALFYFQKQNRLPPEHCPPALMHYFDKPKTSAATLASMGRETINMERMMEKGKKI